MSNNLKEVGAYIYYPKIKRYHNRSWEHRQIYGSYSAAQACNGHDSLVCYLSMAQIFASYKEAEEFRVSSLDPPGRLTIKEAVVKILYEK